MPFLPNNYTAPPSSSNYAKLLEGRNRFRILSHAIVGTLFWKTEGDARKPIRRRQNEPVHPHELEMDPRSGKQERPKHFWAMAAWNYQANAVQILEITQSTIHDQLLALTADDDWNNPADYDITITRTGSGLDTTYHVTPAQKSPLPQAIAEAWANTTLDLDALFRGDDPFDASPAPQTPQADPAAGGPQAGTAETTIRSTDERTHGEGAQAVQVWAANTDAGRFGTTDPGIGEQLPALQGKRVKIDWTQTSGGFRIDAVAEVLSAPPANPLQSLANTEPAGDDIPF